MIKLTDCGKCIHSKGLIDGCARCDAFPDGIPYEYMDKEKNEKKNCNNGIGFEPKEISLPREEEQE